MVGSYRKTKKELKEQVGQGISAGRFVETSLFGNEIPESGTGKFTVVGPDPYRNRKWYATVEVAEGIITKVS